MAKNAADNLCPVYQKLLGKLFFEIEFAATCDEREAIMEKFSEKYFLLPQFWNRFINKYNVSAHVSQIPEKLDTKTTLLYYFLRAYKTKGKSMAKNLEWNSDVSLQKVHRLKDYEEAINLIEDAFYFPHKRMEKFYQCYANLGAQPMTAEINKNYAKNLNLFKEFKEAGENDKKWLTCLKKLENEEAIIANIELRLGDKTSCTNKEIWKFYIEYLRDRDSKAMLEVYLRYCRFFISDVEMVKEYRKEIKSFGNLHKEAVLIFWFDTIEWELEFGDLETAKTLLKDSFESIGENLNIPSLTSKEDFVKFLNEYKRNIKDDETKQLQNQFMTSKKYEEEDREREQEDNVRPTKRSQSYQTCLEDGDTETPAKRRRVQKLPCYYKKSNFYQSFSIPTFLTKYITKYANSTVLSKLHQSSTYFFSILPIPVCHRLVKKESAKSKYFQQSLFISDANLNFLKNQKLYLSNSLAFCSQGAPKSFSSFISKLYKCDAIDILICHETLTVKDLEFLVSSGKVKNFDCYSVRITDENGDVLSGRKVYAFIQSFGNKLENFNISIPGDFLHKRCDL